MWLWLFFCAIDLVADGKVVVSVVPTSSFMTHYFAILSFQISKLDNLKASWPLLMAVMFWLGCPTEGGKSMCMFLILLSISERAMGIVISLLIGLMEQQVSNCIVLQYVHVSEACCTQGTSAN